MTAPYPAPYDRYPDCRYEVAYSLFGTQYGPVLGPDPYSREAFEPLDKAWTHYMDTLLATGTGNDCPPWSGRMALYPYPSWLEERVEKMYDKLAWSGKDFCFQECVTGFTLWRMAERDLFVSPWPLRLFVAAALKAWKDPVKLARAVEGHPDPWCLKQAERLLGEPVPDKPRGPVPVTVIVRPSLADAIPGWSMVLPSYDQVFQEEAERVETWQTQLDPEEGDEDTWGAALILAEMPAPEMDPQEWLDTARYAISPERLKARMAKTRRR